MWANCFNFQKCQKQTIADKQKFARFSHPDPEPGSLKN
jgi:hypothetical protein